ncbi:3-hydroxyisobutyryl-CoA hydrolase 1 [Senna tora]|uniref:3-hydroxyisobutyryl-CoA hydrolase n=1 Tax=Senna tora TaxID=362788 RepID=A0A834XJX5_9FABA|nr:3-hydroxyisobutyryl-CoA hydrolase 1 [Senna tora]
MSKADDWIFATIQSLKKASPTSLKIFLRLIREGRLQGIGQCLVREYRIVCHILKGDFSKDFFEGCRAILLDKDRNPKWEPSKLELVSDSDVSTYFSKLDDEGWKDLELPKRFNNLPVCAMSKL